MKARPPRLYKYEPITIQTLQNLKAQKIFFGSPRNFNDPYDCALKPKIVKPTEAQAQSIVARILENRKDMPVEDQEKFRLLPYDKICEFLVKNSKEQIDKLCEEFLGRRGVACFSEINDSALMWAHYAAKSQGFCLEFDASLSPFEKVQSVEYPTNIPSFDVSSMMLTATDDQMFRFFCTKSSDWAYEREWRGIHDTRDTLFGYDSKCLTGVYFGPRTPNDLVEIVCLILRGQNDTVRFYRGTRSESEYKVVFSQFTYTSYMEAKRLGLRQ
jgi:hypothetical protein